MGQQTIRKAFLSFYVCIAFIIVIIGNIIAPRIALSGPILLLHLARTRENCQRDGVQQTEYFLSMGCYEV